MNKTLALLTGLVVSSTLIASTAPQAQALSLVPQTVGEVSVGASCSPSLPAPAPNPVPPTVSLHESLITSITSLVHPTTGTKSRLFVDQFVNGKSSIFGMADVGTNPPNGEYWFRPSECEKNGTQEEGGQLEVGKFRFDFKRTISFLKVRYFDTEDNGFTQVSSTDGTLIKGINPVPAGPNSNIKYQIWKNVSHITLDLGRDVLSGTGDGVDFQLEAIPEPSALAGLGMVGVGLLANRRRRKSQSV